MNNDFVKVLIVDDKLYELYTVMPDGDTSEGYDLMDENGECINLGSIFFNEPSENDVKNFLENNKLICV